MGTIRSNVGKWKTFVKGKLFSSAGGQNLNVDLQENIGDELDSILDGLVGTAVVGADSWRVQPTVNPLEVKVTAGEGYFAGQRGRSTADFVVTPQLATSATGVQIYIELDDSNAAFDSTLSSWPVRVASAGPLTSLPARAILLATVDTPASGVIAPSAITDKRKVVARDYDAVSGVTDPVTLDDIALSIRHRFDMVLTRIRTIVGRDNWKDGLPGSGAASLKGIWEKFDPATGHNHAGAGINGPRIVSSNVEFTPTQNAADSPIAIGVTANRVQAALEQLVDRKLSRSGIQAMLGPLILSRDPVAELEAATKRYVDQRINMVKVTSTGIRSGLVITGSEASMTILPVNPGTTPSPISISTRGGIVKFESNAEVTGWVEFNTSGGSWSGVLRFRLYRDGVFFDEVSQPVDVQATQKANFHLKYKIPDFYDPSPGGSPSALQPRTYDLRWQFQLESLTGAGAIRSLFTTGAANNQQSQVPGRWYAIET